jgi:hypothetical protein
MKSEKTLQPKPAAKIALISLDAQRRRLQRRVGRQRLELHEHIRVEDLIVQQPSDSYAAHCTCNRTAYQPSCRPWMDQATQHPGKHTAREPPNRMFEIMAKDHPLAEASTDAPANNYPSEDIQNWKCSGHRDQANNRARKQTTTNPSTKAPEQPKTSVGNAMLQDAHLQSRDNQPEYTTRTSTYD